MNNEITSLYGLSKDGKRTKYLHSLHIMTVGDLLSYKGELQGIPKSIFEQARFISSSSPNEQERVPQQQQQDNHSWYNCVVVIYCHRRVVRGRILSVEDRGVVIKFRYKCKWYRRTVTFQYIASMYIQWFNGEIVDDPDEMIDYALIERFQTVSPLHQIPLYIGGGGDNSTMLEVNELMISQRCD